MRHLLTFLAVAIFALVLALVAINFLPNEPLAVDEVALSPAEADACRIHTLPSPCDGKCRRPDQRSIT